MNDYLFDVAKLASNLVQNDIRDKVAADIVRGFFCAGNKALREVIAGGCQSLKIARQATIDLLAFIFFELPIDVVKEKDEVRERVAALLHLGADPTLVLEEFVDTRLEEVDMREKSYCYLIDLLVDWGADSGVSDCLALASYWNARDTVKNLLDVGVDATRSDALAYAFIDKDKVDVDVELISLLIDAGVNVNSCVEWTPLQMAIYNGNLQLVRMFLDAGADVNAFSTEHTTALIVAIEENHVEIVELLLHAQADIYLKGSSDNVDISPIQAADLYDCDEILELLVQAAMGT